MIQAFVICLREGIEVALVLALVLGLLRRTGDAVLGRWAWLGLGAGAAASALLAAAAGTLPVRGEAFEGAMYFAGALLVASLAVWVARSGHGFAAGVPTGLTRAASRWRGGGVALFVFVTVLREGVETVLFLTAAGFSTASVEKWSGAIAGILAAAATGWVFVQGGARLPIATFFRGTTALLLVLAVQMGLAAFHEWSEAGWIPSSRSAMALVGPAVRHQALFFAALALLPAWMLLRRTPEGEAPASGAAGPALRLAEARRRRVRSLRWIAAGVGLGVVAILVADVWAAKRRNQLPDPPVLEPVAGYVEVSEASLAAGTVLRFAVFPAGADRPIRFLALRRADGSTDAALDACEICGDMGYAPDGERIVCRNCAADVDPGTFGSPGGCNPIPLASERVGGALRIREADLAAAAPRFVSDDATRWVVDPVCGMRVREDAAIAVTIDGKSVRVCRSMDCARKLRDGR